MKESPYIMEGDVEFDITSDLIFLIYSGLLLILIFGVFLKDLISQTLSTHQECYSCSLLSL